MPQSFARMRVGIGFGPFIIKEYGMGFAEWANKAWTGTEYSNKGYFRQCKIYTIVQ